MPELSAPEKASLGGAANRLNFRHEAHCKKWAEWGSRGESNNAPFECPRVEGRYFSEARNSLRCSAKFHGS